jgi:hypothetical protein
MSLTPAVLRADLGQHFFGARIIDEYAEGLQLGREGRRADGALERGRERAGHVGRQSIYARPLLAYAKIPPERFGAATAGIARCTRTQGAS